MGNFSLEVVSTQSKVDVIRRMNMEIQKWEYKTHSGRPFPAEHFADPILAENGAEDWELINVIERPSTLFYGEFSLIFKRPTPLGSDKVRITRRDDIVEDADYFAGTKKPPSIISPAV